MELSKEYLDALKKDDAEKIVELLHKDQSETNNPPDRLSLCEKVFLNSAQRGMPKTLKAMVTKMNVDVNVVNEHRYSALDLLGINGNFEMMKFLLDNGAKPSVDLLKVSNPNLTEEQTAFLADLYMREHIKFKTDSNGELEEAIVMIPRRREDYLRVSFEFNRGYRAKEIIPADGVYFREGIDADIWNLNIVAKTWRKVAAQVNVVSDTFRKSKVDKAMNKGLVNYLKKVKFDSKSDTLTDTIARAQRYVLSEWPKYKEKLDAYREAMRQEKLQYKTNKATKQKTMVNSKLATLRKKIAHNIDETFGTNLEEKKIAKPIKKIEKAVSDKLFGKVNE